MTAQYSTLANGFRVASDTMPGLRTAAISVHVRAGARHESKRQNGIAHFLEHMAFKGTESRTAFQIAETIEDVGGFLNAYTGRESTVYLAAVLEEDVSLAVELLADIVRNSVFDPEELELERGVILNEIGEYEDSPSDVVFDMLQKTAFPDQPIGRPIIGTAERVSAFKRSDIIEFVDRHYGPGQIILAAAGAVDHEQMVRLGNEHFSVLQQKNGQKPEAGRFVGGEARREHGIEQAQFTLAFEGPPLLSKLDAVSRVYSVLLGGGSSSRLFAEAREKRGLCYSISAHAAPNSDSGMFVIHASTGEKELQELATLCVDEMRKAAEDLTEKEVSRAKTQIRVGILMAYESPGSRIERLGGMLALKGRLEPLDETIARYDSVTRDDVLKFAADLAQRKNAAMAVYGPVGNAPSLSQLLGRMNS